MKNTYLELIVDMKRLIPMTEADYDVYIEDKMKRYAHTLEENTFEVINDSAFLRAQQAISGYLPHGFNTKNHEFYHILENGKVAGYVWLKVVNENKSAFLYEIYLNEDVRSKGLGKETMTELESLLMSREILFFKLHVFGSNEQAIQLYHHLGFQIAGINMYKELGQ